MGDPGAGSDSEEIGPGRMTGSARNVLDWDEGNDPAQARKRVIKPTWALLGLRDRQLLEALSDGSWVSERVLRGLLKWGRVRFFVVTVRLVVTGWVEARPTDSVFQSEYRLAPDVWQ